MYYQRAIQARALQAVFPEFQRKSKDYIIDVQVQSLIARGIMEEGDLYIIFDPEWKFGIPGVSPYF